MGTRVGGEGQTSLQKVKLRFSHFPQNLNVVCSSPVNWSVHIPPRLPSAERGSGLKETQSDKVPSKPSLEFMNFGQPLPSAWPNTQVWAGLGFQSGSFKAISLLLMVRAS